MNKQISATEAAQILGVSVASLYSYVSRGLLSSVQHANTRSKRYDLDAVLHLAARRSDAKQGGHQVQSAVSWGLPLLETSISQIANGSLYYRGYDVKKLAQTSSLEQIACLLWDDQGRNYFTEDLSQVPLIKQPPIGKLSGIDSPVLQLMSVLPILSAKADAEINTCGTKSGIDFDYAARLMRQMAALLLDVPFSTQAIHQQIATSWDCDFAQTDLIRSTLVLLADHELNASSFAVRCVASTGADLHLALCAGIAAVTGHRHGGGSALVEAFLNEAQGAEDFTSYIQEFFSTHEPTIAGFGHPLYPNGDPRADYLLERLEQLATNATNATNANNCAEAGTNFMPNSTTNARLRAGLGYCRQTAQQLQLLPNMDCVLGLMKWAFLWPDYATSILFIIARSAAWIAHAQEQQTSGDLIRPRARYIGKYRDNRQG